MPAVATTSLSERSGTEALLLVLSVSVSLRDERGSGSWPFIVRTVGGDRSSFRRPPIKLPLGSSIMVRRMTTLSGESRRLLPLLLLYT